MAVSLRSIRLTRLLLGLMVSGQYTNYVGCDCSSVSAALSVVVAWQAGGQSDRGSQMKPSYTVTHSRM